MVDGAEETVDGAQEMVDGGQEMVDGAQETVDGAQERFVDHKRWEIDNTYVCTYTYVYGDSIHSIVHLH